MADRTEQLFGASTIVDNADATGRMSDEPSSFQYFPPEVVEFTATSGNRYQIDFGVQVGEGGEATVFDATDASGARFVAKVYEEPGGKERADHMKVLRFLGEFTRGGLSRCKSTHLMPLLDYGTMTIESRRCVVLILPVCKSLFGDVPVSPKVLKERVIPAVSTALKFLHDRNFVHRDVKPSNIFEYDGVVVLGDFGISTIFRAGEENRATTMLRGTEGYFPNTRVVNLQLDWYSLGYTIWTMYNGNVHPHQHLIDTGNMGDVWGGRRPVSFQAKSQEDVGLRELVYGLTDENASTRFGYDEVVEWLEDPEAFAEKYAVLTAAEGGWWSVPYVFGGERLWDGSQLAGALAGKWSDATEHLFDGGLADHFRRVGDTDTYAKLKGIVRKEAGAHQDRGLAKAIYFISGDDKRLAWRGSTLTLEQIGRDFEAGGAELTTYDAVFKEGLLSWYLEESGSATPDILRVMRYVEGLSKTKPRLARLVYMHCFLKGAGTSYPDVRDADDLAQRVLCVPGRLNPAAVYVAATSAKAREDLIGALAPLLERRGMLEKVNELSDTFGSRMRNDGEHVFAFVNSLLLTLETLSQPTFFERYRSSGSDAMTRGYAIARAFASTFGPSAPWLWVARNTRSYDVREGTGANEAREALRGVSACIPGSESSVMDIQRLGKDALVHCDVIRSSMDVSPMAGYAGVQTDKPVVALEDDALFCASFFGTAVPRGFVRMFMDAACSGDGSLPEAVQKNVTLLTTKAQENGDYLEHARRQCSDALTAAQALEAGTSTGGVAGSVLVSIVGAAILLFGIPWVFVKMLIGFTLTEFVEVTPPPVFLAMVAAVLSGVAFLLFDAIAALARLRNPARARSAISRIQSARDKLEEEGTSFMGLVSLDWGFGPLHPYAAQLLDASQNGRRGSTSFSDTIAAQGRRTGRSSDLAEGALYKVLWHVSAVLVGLLMVFFAFAVVYTLKGYHRNDFLGLADDIFGLVMFFVAWVPGLAAFVFTRIKLGDFSVERYSALGWLMIMATVFLVAFSILWYVFIVLKMLDIMDPYYDNW